MINMKNIPGWNEYSPTKPGTPTAPAQGDYTAMTKTGATPPQQSITRPPTDVWSALGTQPAATSQPTAGFTYPSQWQSASDYFTGMLNSQYAMPQAWQDMYGMTQGMAQTGAPVDYSGWWQAQQPVLQSGLQNIYDMVTEGATAGSPGVQTTGTPWQIANLGTQMLGNLFGQYQGLATQGMESAANRQLAGLNQMYGLGAGEAGLMSDALNRGMSAAGGLAGLGGQYAGLPLSVAGLMGNLGQSLTSQQIDPYTMLMAQLTGNPQFSGMREPSTASNIFGSIANSLPYILSQLGGGGEGWGGDGGQLSLIPGASIW